MNGSIGSNMQTSNNKTLKSLAFLASLLVYCGMLLYSGVHNFSLMIRGVDPAMVPWALLGVVALEISAAALPLALHYWFHSSMQRTIGFMVYGVDLVLICFNVILDFWLATSGTPADWLLMYLHFIAPATPIVAGLGWSLLWLLDPSQRELAMVESLRASTRESLSEKISEAAKAADISEEVRAAADQLTRSLITETIGITVSHHIPGKKREPYPSITMNATTPLLPDRDTIETRKNGHTPG